MEPVRLKFDLPVNEDIINLTRLFNEAGHRLYIVGGAVRDALMGKTPKDYDFATDASPDRVYQIVKDVYPKTVDEPTGRQFGVMNVVMPSETVEVATFRKDIGAGRRPDAVEFSTIDQDAKRRDLTINALYYDVGAGEVIDYVGGLEDLKNGVIRAVGNAADRFMEDKLRIMRAIRFTARMGSKMDPEASQAIMADNSRISGDGQDIAQERIKDEFVKGVMSAKSSKYFCNLLNQFGLWEWVIPGSDRLKFNSFPETKNHVVLLASVLQGNSEKVVDSLLKKAKFSLSSSSFRYKSSEIPRIIFLMRFENLDAMSAPKLKKKQSDMGVSNEDILEFAKIQNMDSRLVHIFLDFTLTVKGGDVMDDGFSGPEIGKEINRREVENFMNLL